MHKRLGWTMVLVALTAASLSATPPAPRGERHSEARLNSWSFDLQDPEWRKIAQEVWERRFPDGTIARHTSGFKGVLWLLKDTERQLAELESKVTKSSGSVAQLFHQRERLSTLAAVLGKSLLLAKAQNAPPGYPTWCNPFTWDLTAGAGITYGASAEGRSTVYYSGIYCTAAAVLDNYAVTNTGQTRDYKTPSGTSINASGSAFRTGTSNLCGRGYSFLIVPSIGFTYSLEAQNPSGCF